MSTKLVFIPGIGADKRAFSKLQINSELEIVYAEWIPLKDTNESFNDYSDRMVLTYQIKSEDVLVGLSFGGLVAQKIAKDLGNRKVILISSFRNKSDLQPLMSLGLTLKLHKILPPFRIPILSDLIAFVLNSWKRGSKMMIKEMLKSADFRFINWAIRQIDQVNLISNFTSDFLSLTGTNDKLVTNWKSENHVTISGGSHFMIYDHPELMSKEITKYVKSR